MSAGETSPTSSGVLAFLAIGGGARLLSLQLICILETHAAKRLDGCQIKSWSV